MIRIALSYRIIKNFSNDAIGEKLLNVVGLCGLENDVESIDEKIFEKSEPDSESRKIMEEEIRSELEGEIEKQRKVMFEAAAAEIGEIKEKARREGILEGYSKGFEKGLEEGRVEAETIKKNALDMFENAKEKVNEFIEESEEKILKLSTKIAEKIVHQTINSHSEGVMLLIRPVLQEYSKAETVVITCNPGIADFVKERFREIEKLCPNAHILILEDKSLDENGLIIENENQITDLQIKNQLKRFMEMANS